MNRSQLSCDCNMLTMNFKNQQLFCLSLLFLSYKYDRELPGPCIWCKPASCGLRVGPQERLSHETIPCGLVLLLDSTDAFHMLFLLLVVVSNLAPITHVKTKPSHAPY